MTDSKEVEQLKADLELVTKTAKVLASKLDKISLRVEQIFASIEGVTIPQPELDEVEKARPAPSPIPTPSI